MMRLMAGAQKTQELLAAIVAERLDVVEIDRKEQDRRRDRDRGGAPCRDAIEEVGDVVEHVGQPGAGADMGEAAPRPPFGQEN